MQPLSPKWAPVWALLLATAPAGQAGAAEPVPDAELLEFLGSVDSEEPGWQEFLAAGPRQVAVRRPAPPRQPPDAKEEKP